jgi:hypothetical protein
MKDNETKKPYEAPQLTVVTFKAERGYANSLFQLALINEATILSSSSNSLEARIDGGNWGGSGGWF